MSFLSKWTAKLARNEHILYCRYGIDRSSSLCDCAVPDNQRDKCGYGSRGGGEASVLEWGPLFGDTVAYSREIHDKIGAVHPPATAFSLGLPWSAPIDKGIQSACAMINSCGWAWTTMSCAGHASEHVWHNPPCIAVVTRAIDASRILWALECAAEIGRAGNLADEMCTPMIAAFSRVRLPSISRYWADLHIVFSGARLQNKAAVIDSFSEHMLKA